ncbi:hypothetical protein LNV75_23090, partial [Klebsiella pneumoniae]|nr:hypothetical protein [Klebsiella pneumoniae]MCJ4364058.1 hypothetical protein [Klebsiella pneumoniae]MCJ4369871.1 hypothetical protein [Klebsiella pneumoniae]MCJ4375283.1 hypothetical protein [Klebsiella pneumoniae]MCJ4380944.1 hypothetical protein [Klebsiella pneumoniae]
MEEKEPKRAGKPFPLRKAGCLAMVIVLGASSAFLWTQQLRLMQSSAALEQQCVVVKFFWTRRSDGRVMHRRATGRQG